MLQLAGHLLYLGYLGSLINRNKKNTTEIKGHCKQAFLFHSIHFDLSQQERHSGTNHIIDGPVPLKCPSKPLETLELAHMNGMQLLLCYQLYPCFPCNDMSKYLPWSLTKTFRPLLEWTFELSHTVIITLMTAAYYSGVPGFCYCACWLSVMVCWHS